MKRWIPRSSKGKSGRAGLGSKQVDIFEQTERSLLGEALASPLGVTSALIIVASLGAFLANHYIFHMQRITDFALLGLFVGGGVLLSRLLRTGDPAVAPPGRLRTDQRIATEEDLVVDEPFATEEPADARGMAMGLAEAPAASAPVPPAALVPPKAVKPAPDPVDDEVGSFQQALVHYVREGDFHGQGEVLRRLGHLAKARGHLKESRDFYMNARSCFRKIEDHYAEAAVLLDLGQVLESLDEHDAASAAYRDANRALLDVAMNSGDRYSEIQAHAAD